MIGDKVFILPSSSIRFGGRWGTIVNVDWDLSLPFIIEFDCGNKLGFDKSEFLTEDSYTSWFRVGDRAYHHSGKDFIINDLKHLSNGYIVVNGNTYCCHELVPITTCDGCGKSYKGLFDNYCEDCQYPIFEE